MVSEAHGTLVNLMQQQRSDPLGGKKKTR